ncbi:MAG: arginase family protein, partial [Ignavibacteria bacterium]|nr:arginase family protein [Ignavibacteria bacterium]
CIEESKLIRDSKLKTFYAFGIKQGKYGPNWIEEVIKSLTDNVFISFDVDFWDPSIMPSTGTPEPGGFLWDETLSMLKPICSQKNILGFDVVELSPKKGLDFPNFLTAKFVYKLLNYIFYKP